MRVWTICCCIQPEICLYPIHMQQRQWKKSGSACGKFIRFARPKMARGPRKVDSPGCPFINDNNGILVRHTHTHTCTVSTMTRQTKLLSAHTPHKESHTRTPAQHQILKVHFLCRLAADSRHILRFLSSWCRIIFDIHIAVGRYGV